MLLLRTIAALVAGFLAIATCMFLAIAAMWTGLGAGFAFEGTGPNASSGWAAGMLAGSFLGSVCSGCAISVIFRREPRRGVLVTISVAVLFTAGVVGMRISQTPPPLPEGRTSSSLSFAEAGEIAVSPDWYFAALGPVNLVGAVCARRIFRRIKVLIA
jgi:hypothetical protein